MDQSLAEYAESHGSLGLLEPTNVSVGRGTDTPFELVGAPWIDGRKLAAELNAARLAGVRFVPVRFTPRASVHRDVECGGINIVIPIARNSNPLSPGPRSPSGCSSYIPKISPPINSIGC